MADTWTDQVLCGDMKEVLRMVPDDTYHCCVTDPPYGLSFMGKDWDHGIPGIPFWKEVWRVCRPGAYLLAFGGTRTFHRLAVAIEDTGWEIRDTIMWVYGSGFPKSLNVALAIDKEAGIVGHRGKAFRTAGAGDRKDIQDANGVDGMAYRNPISDAARQWQGWGTAIKPAHEPIIVARKPFKGTVVENVQKWGTGGINVDGCRVGTDEVFTTAHKTLGDGIKYSKSKPFPASRVRLGRWPANLIHDGSEEVVGLFPQANSARASGNPNNPRHGSKDRQATSYDWNPETESHDYRDMGSAARFFYAAKASKSERGAGNSHPTVKPLSLMTYLVRLVCPPEGLVLDPFCGSGTTGVACRDLGVHFTMIDQEFHSCMIASNRIYG